jgi:predicted nucleic-acid-binding Zn-ribbon protein
MKEDLTRIKIKKVELGKNGAKCSSNPITISFLCSKCGKKLSYEDAYLINTGKKVKTLRSENAAFLAFCCEACLPEKVMEKKVRLELVLHMIALQSRMFANIQPLLFPLE